MKLSVPVLALVALASLPPALADPPLFAHDGGFLLGGPEAFYGPDACTNGGLTEGIDSNCVALDADYAGKTFSFVGVSDDTGLVGRDPNYDVPPEVFGPAVSTCQQTPASAACPTSGNVLYYPLIAAAFYDETPEGFVLVGYGYSGTVPAGADHVAVSASGGSHVAYTFLITQ